MLLGALTLKFSSLLASLTSLHSPGAPDAREQIPITMDQPSEYKADTNLMLSDILTIQNSVSIFFSYARDTHVGELLKRDDTRITVFAPTNKAVMALARKPHQGSTPIDETIISDEEFDARSRENVERWISAHMVPKALSNLSPSSTYETLLEGFSISVTEKSGAVETDKPEWQQVVLNENISIVNRAEAANGVLYLLDGALYG